MGVANWHMEAPFGVVTAVTYRCNLKCKHCFAGSPDRDTSVDRTDMTTAQWKGFLRQLGAMGVHEIYFGGGEPFVRKDMLEIVREARKCGLGTTLTTNGTVLREDGIRELAAMGVECVEISIDGIEPQHDHLRGVPGAFARSMRSIETMAKEGIYIIASVTYSKPNRAVATQILDAVKGAGAKEVLFMRFVPCGTGRKFRDELYMPEADFREDVRRLMTTIEGVPASEELAPATNGSIGFFRKAQAAHDGFFYPHAGCIAGRTYCFLKPNGDITPCNPLNGFPEWKAGNVTETPFAEIWHHAPALKRIRDLDHRALRDCRECDKADVCAGGCRVLCSDYRSRCDDQCDGCRWTEACNEATGLCGKRYMYYVRVAANGS